MRRGPKKREEASCLTALLVRFALLEAGLNLRSRNLFGNLMHHVIEAGPLAEGDAHAVVHFPRQKHAS